VGRENDVSVQVCTDPVIDLHLVRATAEMDLRGVSVDRPLDNDVGNPDNRCHLTQDVFLDLLHR
jgi:hypothetical protein